MIDFDAWFASEHPETNALADAQDWAAIGNRYAARTAWNAAIALMRGQSWQDIATAPEEVPADEAVIVCITYDEPRFAGQRMIGEAYKVDGVWWWAGTHPNDYHTDPIEDMYGLGCVTHWQPLPAPPKDTADEQ